MDSKDQNLTRTKRIHLCPFQSIFVCWVKERFPARTQCNTMNHFILV